MKLFLGETKTLVSRRGPEQEQRQEQGWLLWPSGLKELPDRGWVCEFVCIPFILRELVEI